MADKEDFDLLVIPIKKDQMKTLEEASKYTVCDGVAEYVINIMMTVSNAILDCDEVKKDGLKVVGWKM